MQLRARKYLYDALSAAKAIDSFVEGKTFEQFSSDELLQAGVERKFTIIGEALVQLHALDAHAAEQLSDLRQIISFRNILVHRYADIDLETVWDVATKELDGLIRELEALLT